MLEVVWLNRGIHLSICFLVSGFQYSISSLDKNRGQPSSCGHLFADQANRNAVDHCIFVCVCVIVFVFLSLWSLVCFLLQQIGMLMAVVCARRQAFSPVPVILGIFCKSGHLQNLPIFSFIWREILRSGGLAICRSGPSVLRLMASAKKCTAWKIVAF